LTAENTDLQFMRRALELADYAAGQGEVPVGAVLVRDGEFDCEGLNQVFY
jgi:tRNA(adenine34) deaminase